MTTPLDNFFIDTDGNIFVDTGDNEFRFVPGLQNLGGRSVSMAGPKRELYLSTPRREVSVS